MYFLVRCSFGSGLLRCVMWVATRVDVIWWVFRSGPSALIVGGVCSGFGSGRVYV